MAEAYIGEIRMFAGNFAPQGWELCWGQSLLISQYDVLFSLIGTTYGGDGIQNFNLPDLRSRVPIHMGAQGGHTYYIGQTGGAELTTLTEQNLPAHTHTPPAASSTGNSTTPGGNVWANSPALQFADPASPNATMAAGSMTAAGSGLQHANVSPYLALNFIICLEGFYPTQA